MKYIIFLKVYLFCIIIMGQDKSILVKKISTYPLLELGMENAMAIGGKVVFANDDGNGLGNELWTSDGTDKGTYLLKDINLGQNPSNPIYFKNYNKVVTFQAFDGKSTKVFRTDGTDKGTFEIWDRQYITSTGEFAFRNPKDFIRDSTIFWLTDYPVLGMAVVQKDINGKDIKTIIDQKLVGDTWYAPNNVRISNFAKPFGNKWLINSYTRTSFKEEEWVYISDGTSNGTFKLFKSSEYPGGSQQGFYNSIVAETPNGLLAFFGVSYIFNNIPVNELWRTDGTLSGTKKIIDSNTEKSLVVSGYISGKKTKNGIVFLTASSNDSYTLWFSDGANTKKIYQINGRADFVNVTFANPFEENNQINKPIISISSDNGNTIRYLTTDGTETGTIILQTEAYTSSFGISGPAIQKGNFVYFTNSSSIHRIDLNTNTIKFFSGMKTGGVCGCKIITIADDYIYYLGSYNSGTALFKIPFCDHNAKISMPNGTSFCTGASVNITGEATGTNNPFTFKWKQGTSELGTSTNLNVTKAGTYTLDVIDKNGCTVSTSIDITVTANLPVNITGTNIFCSGQNTTLTANITGGATPFTFQWKNNTTNIGTNSNTYVASVAGIYNVNVIDSKGCTGTSTNYPITQKPSPNVTITKSGNTDLLTGGSVILSVPSATSQTYQWLKDNVAISGSTNNTYTANGAGKFSVAVTSNGCSATSEVVTVNIILANELPNESKNFKVSPNPFENTLKVSFNEPLVKSAKLVLINSIGSVVKEWTTNQQENSLDILGLPSGIYILKCEMKDNIEAVKLIKN